jgi:apolipoprotein N-acyltransferase
LPPFKLGAVLGWFALVPVLIAIFYQTSTKRIVRLARIVGLGAVPLAIGFAWWVPDMLAYFANLGGLFWLWFIIGLALAFVIGVEIYGQYTEAYWKPKDLGAKQLQYLPSGLQIFIIPLVCTAIEFLIMNIPGVMQIGAVAGFWSIAKTQWANSPILRLASFTGMYGVTFLVLLVNCAIAWGIMQYRHARRISKAAIGAVAVFILILSLGWITLPAPEQADTTAAIIQVSRNEQGLPEKYLSFSEESLEYGPEIIIWPALVLEEFWVEPYSYFAQDHDLHLVSFSERGGNAVVSPTGEIGIHNMGYHFGTIAQRIRDAGVRGLFFPAVHGIDTELGTIALLDCIETGSTLPARDLANKGAQFLVVQTGSPNVYPFSWMLGTNAIYRAAEQHMFTACVVGDYAGSLLIDPYGRVIDDTAPEPEIVVGKISFTNQRTFYTKYGDIFGWTVVGLLILTIGYNRYLKRKSPFKYCEHCLVQIPKDGETCEHCGASQKKPPLWKRILLHEYYEHAGRSKKPKK